MLLFVSCATTTEGNLKGNLEQLIEDGIQASQRGNYDKAVEKFKKVIEDHPFSHYAREAELLLADTHYLKGEFEDAASYYTNFITLHPGHKDAPYALFRKGMSYFNEVLSIDRDQTATKKAILAFEDLDKYYPTSIYAAKSKEIIVFLKERLAGREFYVGRFYFKNGNYRAALNRLLNILKEHPEAAITDSVLYYSGESYLEIGEKDLALEMFETLVNNYPDNRYVNKVRLYLQTN
jgi:outer membrane protein assembly factor BamD